MNQMYKANTTLTREELFLNLSSVTVEFDTPYFLSYNTFEISLDDDDFLHIHAIGDNEYGHVGRIIDSLHPTRISNLKRALKNQRSV